MKYHVNNSDRFAWLIDPEKAFPLVADHDKDGVAPGGDVIRALLTKGARES